MGHPPQAALARTRFRFARAVAPLAPVEPTDFPARRTPGIRTPLGLLCAFEPLISDHLARLRDDIEQVLRPRLTALGDPETLLRTLSAPLPAQLLAMVTRTMVLELNVARLEGRLSGDTPEDRFRHFVESVRQPATAFAIRQEYPVLDHQVSIRLDQWVARSLEFLTRLSADWDLIRETFRLAQDPGVLVDVDTGAGDRHRQGRSVSTLRFSGGFQLVYKPRALAVDAHFQELLAWMNHRGASPLFRTLCVLDRGTYGWEEFVTAESCASLPALRRFYERQGAYLALLYLLEATDCHRDNVIAAGEHPMFVDPEGIFQPRVRAPEAAREAPDLAAISHSVLRVALLPQRVGRTPEGDGLDLSGLGGAPGQLTPYPLPDWENAGTDEMRLTRKRVEIPVAPNQPAPDIHPADYAADILAGFSRAYRLLINHREQLLSVSGPLARFADDEVRAILRPTGTYGELLHESYHPDVLRRAADRDRLFDRLRIAVEWLPHLSRLIEVEQADLGQGDIPIFTTRPSSGDLWTSSGRRIRDFFDTPALTAVYHRLRHLGERDLERQRWMIRAALATTAPADVVGTPLPTTAARALRKPVEQARLLQAARSVGNQLASMAVRWNQEASWVGLGLEGGRHWSISPLTLDLYDGLPGVALFLAYLGAMTDERRFTGLAHAACAGVLRRVNEYKSLAVSIGGFTGWGGLLYTLAHLNALWREPTLLIAAESIVELLPAWIEQDDQYDIIGGAAGCIGGLIALHHQRPSGRTLRVAVACGEHLLRRAERTEPGVGWTVPGQRVPLAGFSHGAAGIAWSLLKLAALSGEDRFRATALAAIAYERSLFSPEARNWRDLRLSIAGHDSHPARHGTSFMTAWCHGAPGIGLGRLATLQQLDDPAVREEIETALRTTLDHGFGRGHALCHGDLGNLELLLQAGTVLADRRWHEEAYCLAGPIADCVSRNEGRCGTPREVESPGLMTGLAGIGYGLLRLAEPARVPSVLTLEPHLDSSTTARNVTSATR